MKLLIVQLPPFSRHLIPLRSKYHYAQPLLLLLLYSRSYQNVGRAPLGSAVDPLGGARISCMRDIYFE
jgi:hypothetical protein